MPVVIQPDTRSPERRRADDEIAAACERGEVPAGWQRVDVIPVADQWAVAGVLFARFLGFGAGVPADRRHVWDEGLRQEFVTRHPECQDLLTTQPRRLTPEVEAAVRAVAGEYHTRFLAGLATTPALARG